MKSLSFGSNFYNPLKNNFNSLIETQRVIFKQVSQNSLKKGEKQ